MFWRRSATLSWNAKINDITPDSTPGDYVISAADAATKFVHGNLRIAEFPAGQDPRAAVATSRIDRAAIHLQKQSVNTERVDKPLAKAIVAAVLAHSYHNITDPDLGPDEIVELHNTARSFRNSGMSIEDLQSNIATLISTLRDIVSVDRNNKKFDEELFDLMMQMTDDN